MKAAEHTPGDECTINRDGDIFLNAECRKFIGADCVIVKKTKSGLVQVALKSDPRQVHSFSMRNVQPK